MLLKKDSSGSSEEEASAAMAHSGHITNKVEESDDEFNSNQFSPDTATLSVLCCRLFTVATFSFE